ncbi:MAG: CBS domain-containing protein [Burkholderiaceae bacterium]|nr:MAG: CBS domain-containing protein [Burkholderiaceae bacterium]
MSEPAPSRTSTAEDTDRPQRTLLERISTLLLREPEDREQLLTILHSARERDLLDADALSMIEGVLQVSELSARDIMIPRSQMDVVDVNQPLEDIVALAIETSHSRFPVFEENRDNVIGILLAKDLLRFYAHEDFDLRDMLRPAVFIPESKRLNILLRDFRSNRNHMAMVVDEYGGVAGLITIEDVLEQIVGDIDDEYDFDEEEDNILPVDNGRYRIKALTEIAQFNETFDTQLSDDDMNTVGGLVTDTLGHVPHRGEKVVIANFSFEVLRADARQVHVLLVDRLPEAIDEEASATS